MTLEEILKANDYISNGWRVPPYCCENWVESNIIKKATVMPKVVEFKEEKTMMNTNMFNGIFGRIEPGMCRISMSGKIAIKTSNGFIKW